MRFSASSLLGLAALTALLAAATGPAAVDAACGKVTIRKEWRTMTVAEKTAYLRAVRQLQTRPPTGGPSEYDKLVQVHVKQAPLIHGTAVFLPWHRFFLFVYEKWLQKVDPNVFAPYWNWQLDSQTPELADVFSDDPNTGFGMNGDPAKDRCVLTGAFADWRPMVPDDHCLRRQWTESDRIEAFYSPENINALVAQSHDFAAFAPALERTPHGQVHNAIGGEVGDLSLMHSPNDPLFWLHHGNIDKIWSDWQAIDLKKRLTDYSGPKAAGSTVSDAKIDDSLPGWTLNGKAVKPQMVMSIDKLCIAYADLDGKAVNAAGEPVLNNRLIRRRLGRRAPVNNANDPDDGLVTVVDAPVPDKPHFCSRQFINLLLPPPALPSVWITMNGLREEDVRKDEAEQQAVIHKINKVSGYTSVACVLNQRERFAKLVEQVPTFLVYTEGKEIQLRHNEQDPLLAANNIAARAEKACPSHQLQKPIDQVREEVVSIIGEAYGNPSRADNPLRSRH